MLTPRQQIVLAALAAEQGAAFAPVQLQKLFFLVDENLASELGGRQFRFAPYDYGPFDADVYRDLERLRDLGLAQISGGERASRRYALTPSGYQKGTSELSRYEPTVADYLRKASAWVRSMSFAELVGSIYKAYPHMKANSVFNG